MRALVITKPGGPEVLEVKRVPEPALPPSHVRVNVRWTAVNRADLLQRQGLYPAPRGVRPDIPGLEYMGVVSELGSGSTRFNLGDRVMGLVGGGACAEQVVVHEREAVRVPPQTTDEQAAACPEAYATALDALLTQAALVPGERVLIHACGSGVGTAAVQVAAALGCVVLGTSRSQDKLDRCKALGLHHGILVERGAFAPEVLARTGGADVVLDLVGGAYLQENVAACAPVGRIILVGLTGGNRAELALGDVLTKRLTLRGTVLRSRPLEEKIAVARQLKRTLVPWLAQQKVSGVVDRTFPLEQAAQAHTHVGQNHSFGKVLLSVNP